MRRAILGLGLAVAVVVVVVGGVAAANGISQLQVFEPASGQLARRLDHAEDFLASNSRTVKAELTRMQGEIDGLRPASQATPAPAWTLATDPETCPTAAEQTYIRDLMIHVES